MKGLFLIFLLGILSSSCSILDYSYEALYKLKVSGSSYFVEVKKIDGKIQESTLKSSGEHSVLTQVLSPPQGFNPKDDEAFKKLCLPPSALIKEIRIYTVSSSTKTLWKTISITDSQWTYRRISRNIASYTYEVK